MKLYDEQCRACGRMSVLYGVCRECGQLHPQPVHPLHPDGEHDAPESVTNSTPELTDDPQRDDERGDASDDLPDFDLGAGR